MTDDLVLSGEGRSIPISKRPKPPVLGRAMTSPLTRGVARAKDPPRALPNFDAFIDMTVISSSGGVGSHAKGDTPSQTDHPTRLTS